MHWQNLEQKDEKTLPEKVDPNVLDTDILVNISEDDDFLDNGSGSGSDIKKKGSARQSNTNKNEWFFKAEVALSKQQRRLTNGFLKQMMHSMFTIFAIKFLLGEESMDELSSLSRQWKGVKISQTILSNF